MPVAAVRHDPALIKELLDYDPETGEMRWKIRVGSKKRLIGRGGKVAGTITPDGYRRIALHNKLSQAHVLAWVIMTGEWPPTEMDHIDGNRANNAWSNLRLATRTQQNWNKKATGRTGFKGIYYHKKARRWAANYMRDKKTFYLGLFDTPEEAHAAWNAAVAKTRGEYHRSA